MVEGDKEERKGEGGWIQPREMIINEAILVAVEATAKRKRRGGARLPGGATK